MIASKKTGIPMGRIAKIFKIEDDSKKNDFQFALKEAVIERNIELMWQLLKKSAQGSEDKKRVSKARKKEKF